ncbi:NAD(P)/FAD-dependent oxidoreductase [Embleya sp. NBC_00896]|uniref:NAD(P)/FAD-dependent oxidoreductase n=1 Tax=Embleya sp. NBC_00896 TaxID=2975961 RepID=UPI00386F2BB3|nr:NAD(P)/FAD-dependent oxidoreductase [Embleya sp. NBC_00896]
MSNTDRPRILIVGGGYVGLYAAQRILKKMRYGEATVTVVDPRSYMTYQPFLPEAAAGSISPRHVVVPLRRVLPKAEIVNGRVTSVDHDRKVALVEPLAGESYELGFDYIVIALGSISRTFPIPGLAENGIGLKTIEEAIALRNHVLGQLDLADSTTDEEIRRKALTFCFVGGGFAGIEALAEVEDMARDAVRYYKNLRREDMRFVMVEAANRILPEVGPELGAWTLEKLKERDIEFHLETSLKSCVDKHCVLSNDIEFDASTILWTAGVKPNPVLSEYGLPLGPRGHVDTRTTLQVVGMDNVFSAGDNAQVPDLAVGEGAWCPPNAQHAVRQARVLGDNVVSVMRGFPPKEYKHKNLGAVAGLGLHKGVAVMFGRLRLKGLLAWLFHRTYHGAMVPTFNRKFRVFADWTLSAFFRREIVSLGAMEHPRDEFAEAALPVQRPAVEPAAKG